MFSDSLKLVTLLAAVVSFTTTAATDDPYCVKGCQCVWLALVCDDAGLQDVPTGSQWSYIYDLYLSGNNISTVHGVDFSTLPSLQIIYMNDNALSVLEMDAFATAKELSELRVAGNVISSVVPPRGGVRMTELSSLTLSYNQLESLEPHVFDFAPQLRYLYLDGNPLILPSGKPFLVHDTIQVLSLNSIYAVGFSNYTLSGLPNLDTVGLNTSGVVDLSGVFASAPYLTRLDAQGTDITTLPADAFAKGSHLENLNLQDTLLQTVEPGALDAFALGAVFSIARTPLACQGVSQEVRQWTLQHQVKLDDSC